jgi:transcriptional regulator with XRE-family HTH domain
MPSVEAALSKIERACADLRAAMGQARAEAPAPAPEPDRWPADRLRALRAALGLSQSRFALRIGMTGANAFIAISHAENGRQRIPAKYQPALDALEIEARRQVQAQPATSDPSKDKAAAPAVSREIRTLQACGCVLQKGVVLRWCVSHAPKSSYRPAPARTTPRPDKPPTVPLPRGGGGPGQELCLCGDVLKDHDGRAGRCWVCGRGDGRGCQRFRSAGAKANVTPPA